MGKAVIEKNNNIYTVNLRDENVHVQFLEPVNNTGGYGVLVRRGSEVYAYSGWSENGEIVDFIRNRISYDYFWSNLDHGTNGYGSRYLDLSPVIENILESRRHGLTDEWEAREQYDEWKQHQEDGVTRDKLCFLLDVAQVEELCLSELPSVELRSHRDLYNVVMDVCDFVLSESNDSDTCTWSIHNDECVHSTSCKKDFIFNDYEVGTDKFLFDFCPYCGKKAVEKIWRGM